MFSRRKSLSILTGAAFMAVFPTQSYAHKQKTTLTQVEWNERDKALYVTHSYHIHDAETALAKAGIIDKPDLTSLKARAKLALYTSRNFKLFENDQELELELLGAENEGRTIYVYQQTSLPKPPTKLIVSATMLREIVLGQINNVDITLANDLKSLKFEGSDGPKKLSHG